MTKPNDTRRFDTLSLHRGTNRNATSGSRTMPVYQTVCYHFDDAEHAGDLFALETDGYIYSRLNNPTVNTLEQRVASLEKGTAAVATSSGLAANFITFVALMNSGDDFIASLKLYGGSGSEFKNFKKFGWTANFVRPQDPDEFRKALTPKTKAIYMESASNPAGVIPDFDEIAKIAQEAEIPLIIDNTMPTPALFNPIDHGANIVIHSLTKYMNGHANSMGGMAVDCGNFDWTSKKFPSLSEPDESYQGLVFAEKFGNTAFATHLHAIGLRDFGPAMAPMNAFLTLTGIETLSLRMKKHVENADLIAGFLDDHDAVEWVNYPRLKSHESYANAMKYMPNGTGSVFSFGLKNADAGKDVVTNCELFSNMAHMGDTHSLIIHPGSTTHRQLTEEHKKRANCTDEVIRVSVGIEDPADLIEDLRQAIEKAIG